MSVTVVAVSDGDGPGDETTRSSTGQEPRLFSMLHQGVRLGEEPLPKRNRGYPRPDFGPEHYSGRAAAAPTHFPIGSGTDRRGGCRVENAFLLVVHARLIRWKASGVSQRLTS